MSDLRRAALRALLNPRSVAVIGASENPDKIGGRPLAYLARFGYRGRVLPVNAKRREVQGFAAWPDLGALPEVPEVAIVALPGDLAVDAVLECAAAGVRGCVVMTSGFGETDPGAGREKERRMRDAAAAAGMRIVGPNSQGLANFGTGAILSFSSMYHEIPAADGPVGVVSQSGAMSVVPYALLREQGIGVRHSHATGNECDVTVAELACVMAEDPDLHLLLLYLESITEPTYLAELASIARARGLPVVALKAGRTPAGQIAARSHTGALANEDRVVDAFLERHGIARVRDAGEMVRSARLYLKRWQPSGRRLVAISNSGAVCVMAADAATDAGLPLADLSAQTRSRLEAILPAFATSTNPIDLTAALMTNSRLFGDILPVLAQDPSADAFLVGIPVAGQAYDVAGFARDTAEFAQSTGKPVVVSACQEAVRREFLQCGLPVFTTEADAVGALSQYLAHMENLRQLSTNLPAVPRVPAPGGAGTPLNEARSLALLGAAGLPVVAHRLCQSAAEAVAALHLLGAPVAVKACSGPVVHKSDLGLVRLGLRDEAQVREAFAAMRAGLDRAGAPFEGVLVAAMVRAPRELMLGARVDPVFGPVVVVGDGGRYVEAMPDVALLLPPFTVAEVLRALQGLRIAPVLAGVRGERPLDTVAFAQAAVALGRAFLATDSAPISVDVNPVMVGYAGEGCCIVDAVVFARAS